MTETRSRPHSCWIYGAEFRTNKAEIYGCQWEEVGNEVAPHHLFTVVLDADVDGLILEDFDNGMFVGEYIELHELLDVKALEIHTSEGHVITDKKALEEVNVHILASKHVSNTLLAAIENSTAIDQFTER